jgi:hypothetical protein
MKLIVDGKPVEVKNDVRVVYDYERVNWVDGLEQCSVEVVLNHEGFIADLHGEDGDNISTCGYTVDEIAEDLCH